MENAKTAIMPVEKQICSELQDRDGVFLIFLYVLKTQNKQVTWRCLFGFLVNTTKAYFREQESMEHITGAPKIGWQIPSMFWQVRRRQAAKRKSVLAARV